MIKQSSEQVLILDLVCANPVSWRIKVAMHGGGNYHTHIHVHVHAYAHAHAHGHAHTHTTRNCYNGGWLATLFTNPGSAPDLLGGVDRCSYCGAIGTPWQ